MQLDKIDDPRAPIDRARRTELLAFARAKGVVEIKHDMPATLMRRILKLKGVTDISPPARPLGMQGRTVIAPTLVTREGVNCVLDDAPLSGGNGEMDADELLIQSYRGDQRPPHKMSMAELRAECRARGIRQPRGASAAQLQELLNNGNAS